MTGRTARGAWDDGSAKAGTTGAAPAGGTAARVARNTLDRSHDSAARGEHRYPDAHQTEAEQQARRQRDDFKDRLSGGGGHSRR